MELMYGIFSFLSCFETYNDLHEYICRIPSLPLAKNSHHIKYNNEIINKLGFNGLCLL